MRIALFGGRFDPPHYGHLILARDIYESGNFDVVRFLVNYDPPHKKAEADFTHRVRMLHLLIRGERGLEVEPFEGVMGISPSYTYRVLKAYREAHPNCDLHFIVGEDQLSRIRTWKNYEELPKLAKFVLLKRGTLRVPKEILETFRPMVLTVRKLDVSASEIRRRIREGLSLRGLTSDEVIDYIHLHGLYGEDETLSIYTDASARGNPGEVTIAFVVRRGERTIYEYARVVGYGTNNEGEYWALIEALSWAEREGLRGFVVYMDSSLVVNQLRGTYRVRSPKIKPLHERAVALLRALNAKVEHIPRSLNVSDRLTRLKTPSV
ncbi:MAG: nicotinate (nicotinamide) nucleotide adenylyltransferase [Thermotogae bacterium]|nr:nicotinate (nicotinamide) nucleotide adenylyltransferase [Thermotogota bacterium]